MLHFILIVHLSQTWLLQIPATASKIKMEGYLRGGGGCTRKQHVVFDKKDL